MVGRVPSHRLLSRALVALAATTTLFGAGAGAAQAADRADPIPPAVGPPGAIGFYVNPNAPGFDAARVQAILVRSLSRWGDPFLGLTTALPGAADGRNVIGIADQSPETLGVTRVSTQQTTTPVAATQACTPSPRELSDAVRRTRRTLVVRLRRDSVAGGRVRRRSVKRKIRVPRFTLVRAPATAQLCTLGAATTSIAFKLERDVFIRPSPRSGSWQLGPALPTAAEYDFETTVLHELAHVSGLAHTIDECDPSSPVTPGQANGTFWHALDDFRRPRCPSAMAPAPPPPAQIGIDSTEPLPGPLATALAGRSILINPRVPAGYDAARFVAVADRAIRRAGGTPAGLTDAPPASGDGRTVLGFSPLGGGALSSSRQVPRQQILQAYPVSSCPRARVRVRRQVASRRSVRRRGRRLRRDVVVTRTRTVSGYRCTTVTRPPQTTTIASELDLLINDSTIAWEFGPKLPLDGTRWDLETTILQVAGGAGGAPPGTACDPATPNSSSGHSPGDWWRSTSQVRRTRCMAGGAGSSAATRAQSDADHELIHRAGGLPADLRPAARRTG